MSEPIGIIGGSGLYDLFDDAEGEFIETPYGTPSSPVTKGTIDGRDVYFLTRHGSGHSVPPHLINYRANIAALAQLGVKTLITSSVVGSLRADYAPGDFVITDQFVDRTWGRTDTFFEGPEVVHVSLADPYCPAMREVGVTALEELKESFHPSGTSVVIQGPRFSTRAESMWFRKMGWDVLSMTQHPETALAREQSMCVFNISFVSDLDAGVEGVQDEPVTAGMVWRRVAQSQPRIKAALTKIIGSLPAEGGQACTCREALADV